MIKCNNSCPLDKFNGCCHSCPEYDTCEERCEETPAECGESTFDEESGLQAFESSTLEVLNAIATLTAHKKAIEDQEKDMKAKIYAAMEKYGVKKFETNILTLTLVAPTTSTSIDSTKLKKKYPAIADECSKVSSKAGYVKITLKEGDQ